MSDLTKRMSVREKFRKEWTAKFPKEIPPDLNCFEEVSGVVGQGEGRIDVAAFERSLQKSNELISELNIRLQRQEFISSFLWETIHNFKQSQTESTVEAKTPKLFPLYVGPLDDSTALDDPIPLQDAASVSFSPTTDDSCRSGQTSPSGGSSDISFDISRSGLLVKQHSADCILSAGDSNPNLSTEGNLRKQSVPILDWEEQQRLVQIHDENRTRSLDSGKFLYSGQLDTKNMDRGRQTGLPMSTFQPNRPEQPLPVQTTLMDEMLRPKKPKPVPAPRMSIMKPVLNNDLSSNSPSPPMVGAAEDVGGQKKIYRSFQSDNKNNVNIANRKGHNSMKNLQMPPPPIPNIKPKVSSPSSGSIGAPRLRLNTSDGLGSRPMMNRSPDFANQSGGGPSSSPRVMSSYDPSDYEEAMPVQRAHIEPNDASSDEDEPLYYNLMLLKQQTLSRVQTMYKYEQSGKQGNHGNKLQPGGGGGGAYHRMEFTKEHVLPAAAALQLSSDSLRSTGSDCVFEEKPGGGGWQKRRSMYQATDSVDSQSECDELDTALPLCPEDEKLQMRKWVVSSILDSEHSYLNILDILMQYMQTFKNLLGSAQAVISSSDIDTIFNKIPELHWSHKMFVRNLEPKVESWSAEQQVADLFSELALVESTVASEYLKNYQKAVGTLHRCWQENPRFAELTKAIQVKGMKEKPSLEELLHKPIIRFQRNTLVLHDLVKCTPTSHTDYDTLMKTLQVAHTFLDNFENIENKVNPENQRYLAKQGLIVEKMENTRKLRHLFLFNDILICARQKISAKQKIHYEPKWSIPLTDLSLDDKACVEEEKQLADCQQQEIEELQRKVSELQCELKTEMKLTKGNGDAQRQWSFHNRSRNMEKIKKKLMEQQAAMIKASPRLLFRVHNRRIGRQYTLLMASDYERANWRSTIAGLLSRAQGSICNLSSADLQNLLNSQKLPKVSTLAAVVGVDDINLEEEHLFGNLNTTIFRLTGLTQPADLYCVVEIDSFGHFFVKAKTKIVTNTTEPVWNEDFEIDLEGAQTFRILCYKISNGVGSLIGTCALELSKGWLRGDFHEKNVPLNKEISLTISLRYFSREQTLKRALSTVRGGVFGAKLRTVAKHEGTNVPDLVYICVEEVEKRGMTEVGIYRVSGVSADIQRLKKAFEKNIKVAIQLVKELDINVVTGLLKLFFRELPEALFTDASYSSFVKGMGLSDPEAKEKYIQSVVENLPEPNRSTVLFLLDHLIKIAANESENKMTLQNLSTVFGPTLLRPAIKEIQQQTLEELFSTGTRDAMMQTSILLYILNNRSRNSPC